HPTRGHIEFGGEGRIPIARQHADGSLAAICSAGICDNEIRFAVAIDISESKPQGIRVSGVVGRTFRSLKASVAKSSPNRDRTGKGIALAVITCVALLENREIERVIAVQVGDRDRIWISAGGVVLARCLQGAVAVP